MRTLVPGLVAAACFLLLAPAAHAEGWLLEDYLREKPQSEWEGYGVGTMTHRRVKQDVEMPGQGSQQTVMEEKKTIKEITETEIVLEVEKLNAGQWTTTEEREQKDKGLTPKIEDQGTETVTLGGTAYECAKKKVEWMKGDTLDETVVVWAHPEKGILKMAIKGDNDIRITVSNFDATWTVGDQQLTGRTFDMEMTTQTGMKMTGKASMTHDAPESLVRNELSGAQGPVKVSVLMELIAFEKK